MCYHNALNANFRVIYTLKACAHPPITIKGRDLYRLTHAEAQVKRVLRVRCLVKYLWTCLEPL